MGLIKEPINVDFSIKSKLWTEKELMDFRKLMSEIKAKDLEGEKVMKKVTNLNFNSPMAYACHVY